MLRLGVNTSTTDKFSNRMYLNVYCERKRADRIVEEEEEEENDGEGEIIMVEEKLEGQSHPQ